MAFPKRPPEISFSSLCELYLQFQSMFLAGKSTGHEFESACGCRITVFDHHFFHIVKLCLPGVDQLFMRNEKPRILAQIAGFGHYTYDHNRAKHMASALDTLTNPHFVYRTEKLDSADRVFIKQYDSLPYPYTAALIAIRDNGLKVPVTTFPIRKSGIKKWTRGGETLPINTTATLNGGCVDTLRGLHPQSFGFKPTITILCALACVKLNRKKL